jgi:hypothetical protein
LLLPRRTVAVEEQRALKGYTVTTGRFTEDAIESARQSPKVKLIDREERMRWHEPEGKEVAL